MLEGFKGDVLENIKEYYEKWEEAELPRILEILDLKEEEWKRGDSAPGIKERLSRGNREESDEEVPRSAGPSGKGGLTNAPKLVESSSGGSDSSDEEDRKKESATVLQPKSKVMAKKPLVEGKKRATEGKSKRDKKKPRSTK